MACRPSFAQRALDRPGIRQSFRKIIIITYRAFWNPLRLGSLAHPLRPAFFSFTASSPAPSAPWIMLQRLNPACYAGPTSSNLFIPVTAVANSPKGSQSPLPPVSSRSSGRPPLQSGYRGLPLFHLPSAGRDRIRVLSAAPCAVFFDNSVHHAD